MENKPHIIPATAVNGIGTGMLMMAVFTCLWAGMAFDSLYDSTIRFALVIFPLLAMAFIGNALKMYKISKYFPSLTSESEIAEGKKMGKWFGIVFAAEGLGIFIGVNLVVNLGHPNLTIPMIALIVGLHFYPMAKIFKRTIDYYLATWSTVVAICGFLLIINKIIPDNLVNAFIGIGLAIATSCYGSYMVINSRKIARNIPNN